MNVYLCARYERLEEMKIYAEELRHAGHNPVSTWHDAPKEQQNPLPDARESKHAAVDAITGILNADAFIAFTEKPEEAYPRGGRHAELGIAVSNRHTQPDNPCNLPIVLIVGPPENIFCHLPGIMQLPTWTHALELLDAITTLIPTL